ncbi:MAG: hypothetical protein MK324_17220 [Pirellulales bacterium]|nr:hypothetical protein [Pirellulales bacterium]
MGHPLQHVTVLALIVSFLTGCTDSESAPVANDANVSQVQPNQLPAGSVGMNSVEPGSSFNPQLNKAEIIDAHIKAVGGLDAIKKVKSIVKVSQVISKSAAGESSGTTTEVFDLVGERGRVDLDLQDFKEAKGWRGQQGWSVSTAAPLRASTLDEVGVDKITVPISIVQAISGAFGTEAFRSVENVQFDGKPCIKMTIINNPLIVYLDAATKLIAGFEIEQFMVLYLGDYREVQGVQMAYYSKADITVLQTSFVSNVKQVNLNVEITDEQLAKPTQ